jgi:hypothetical protein
MTTPSLNIAWSIAEIEASSAGFDSILPTHFWIGCCKACDLDLAKFLQDATPEVQGMGNRGSGNRGSVSIILHLRDLSGSYMARLSNWSDWFSSYCFSTLDSNNVPR